MKIKSKKKTFINGGPVTGLVYKNKQHVSDSQFNAYRSQTKNGTKFTLYELNN